MQFKEATQQKVWAEDILNPAGIEGNRPVRDREVFDVMGKIF